MTDPTISEIANVAVAAHDMHEQSWTGVRYSLTHDESLEAELAERNLKWSPEVRMIVLFLTSGEGNDYCRRLEETI